MKNIAIITCSSFTGVILLFCLFSQFNLAPFVTNTIAIQVFIMTLSIGLLISASEKVEDHYEVSSILWDTFIKIVICFLTVFLEGSFFGMIPFSLHGFLEIIPVTIPVFLITYGIGYLTCAEWAVSINQHIANRKRQS